MTNIVIIGAAGRMGRAIVKNILESSDFKLVGAVEAKQSPFLGTDAAVLVGGLPCGIKLTDDLKKVPNETDVVIDFSTGDVVSNARESVRHGAGVVIGTTALSEQQKQELKNLVTSGARIVCAPNMSVGVNMLFHIAGEVAKILGDGYDIELVEMHHNQKKDAPSGTAMKLVEVLANARNMDIDKDVCYGRKGIVGERPKKQIGVHAVRGGDIIGEHTVIFSTNGEKIELTHKATSRETFALGALRAARYVKNAKPGCYDMQDVLRQRTINKYR